MTRLEQKMAALKAAGRKGIFIYITAGAPDIETSKRAILEAEKAGADVIELGLPFSDPMADGPVIQDASVCALRNGMTTKKELAIMKELRTETDIPVIGMGYINAMYHYGFEKFVTDFKRCARSALCTTSTSPNSSRRARRRTA